MRGIKQLSSPQAPHMSIGHRLGGLQLDRGGGADGKAAHALPASVR